MADRSTVFMRILIVAAVVLVLLVTALLVLRQADKTRADLPELGEVPPFELTDQQGRAFGKDDLFGKLTVVDFIFTRCLGACPIMAVNMGDLYQAFGDADDIQFVSITVDPAHDTLEVLQAYAEEQQVTDDQWRFLRGPMPLVSQLLEDGFQLSAEDLPGAHSTKFVLVDRDGIIRGYYDGLDKASTKILKTHLAELAVE